MGGPFRTDMYGPADSLKREGLGHVKPAQQISDSRAIMNGQQPPNDLYLEIERQMREQFKK